MTLPPVVADRTLSYLRRLIPRGYNEQDDLLTLIRFYEKAALRNPKQPK
jgi:hypothetical protein